MTSGFSLTGCMGPPMPTADPALRLDLSAAHLAELQRLLREHVPSARVWAYGSRVIGGAHEGSDLDLVLRDAQDPERRSEGLAALRTALSDSSLPMLVDVHDWADLPDSFRREIEQSHLELN